MLLAIKLTAMYLPVRLYLTVIACFVILIPLAAQNDSGIFGSKNFLPNGLWGKVFALPDTTTRLPDFDTMKVLGTIYTKAIDIPTRNWTEGFPGTTDRYEWFGIEYKSLFKPKKKGLYKFRLLSDDGSKLFIDEKLVIDNDGQHGSSAKQGEIELNTAEHNIRLQYFQGPRAQIALQLFAAYQNESEEIFPGNNFTLTTPTEKTGTGMITWGIIIIVAALIFILLFRKKRRKKPSLITPNRGN